MMKVKDRPDLVTRSYEKHLESGRITPRDAAIVREYVNEKQATGQIKACRAQKIVFTLLGWRKYIHKPYDQIDIVDVFEALKTMPISNTETGGLPAQNTVNNWIRILKPFLFWLNENEYNHLPEKKLRLIKAPGVNMDTKRSEDILTIDEVKALIMGATNIRDRAFISLMYETGGRVGEISSLTWKDITFDKYGAAVTLRDTKNMQDRYSRITMFTEYLATWRNHHPNPTPDTLVFLDQEGKEMEYSAIRKMMQRAKEHSEVEKRVHPHLFRSSRATHMVAQGYQESVIKSSLWNNLNTNMFKTYVKLDKSNIDAEFLKQSGVEVPEDEKAVPIKAVVCPTCHLVSPPTNQFCSRCGNPLSEDAKKEFKNLKEHALKDPKILKILMELADME